MSVTNFKEGKKDERPRGHGLFFAMRPVKRPRAMRKTIRRSEPITTAAIARAILNAGRIVNDNPKSQ